MMFTEPRSHIQESFEMHARRLSAMSKGPEGFLVVPLFLTASYELTLKINVF